MDGPAEEPARPGVGPPPGRPVTAGAGPADWWPGTAVPSLPPASVTALGVAAVRAAESTRTDRVFDDPMAAAFLRHAGWEGPPADDGQRRRLRRLVGWVTARTWFLDGVVRRACDGGCRQVVLLGAGLDTRAFRLPWPDGTRLFELDLPDIAAFKTGVIEAEGWRARCRRTVVPVDLEGDWATPLLAAGFDRAVPTVWLAEGLVAYLSARAADALLDCTARLSPPGSRLGLTLASPRHLERWRHVHPTDADTGDSGAARGAASPEDAPAWLAGHGWLATGTSPRQVLADLGRLTPAPEGEDGDDDTGGSDTSARLIEAVRAGAEPPSRV